MSTDFTTITNKRIIGYVADTPGVIKGALVDQISNHNPVGVNKARAMIDALVDNGNISLKTDGKAKRYYPNGTEYNPLDFAEVEEVRINSRRIKPRHGFVYGIQIDGEQPIKIGRTSNLKKRIEMMQTSHFRAYVIVFSILVSNTIDIERAIHDTFYDRRISGEWFDVTVEELRDAAMKATK